MKPVGAGIWEIEVPLAEVGYFQAKPFALDPRGFQHWPSEKDLEICVHPDDYRSANTIYCAFTRLFGPGKTAAAMRNVVAEAPLADLDRAGYTVIPPSGTLRDLIRELPHIFEKLGCRILQLLPVNPTPTTFARFGRFGSPYAGQDLTAIDPALVELDHRTTGVDQFIELADAVHAWGGRLFLDLVINHTGWGSRLFEERPDWFLRDDLGRFVSPGAWGNIWADLVELKPEDPELWEVLASAFLTWCRRGVDGFRCDAGYKVPVPVWRYVVARVRQEFPNALFLLEGLGGGWVDTEALLTEGGMQWAYSELFQEFSGLQIAGYMDHALKQSQQTGLLVHYSETHDNLRLAARGRAWSLMRNRLCALVSPNGGYGFTCGVEWLAAEKIDVHQSAGLCWNSPENIVSELAVLNRLLADHSCFFDGAICERLSAPDASVYVLLRTSACRKHHLLVLVNPQLDGPKSALWRAPRGSEGTFEFERWVDLLQQSAPVIERTGDGVFTALLSEGSVYGLSPEPFNKHGHGAVYRRAKAQAAWGMQRLAETIPLQHLGAPDSDELTACVAKDPAGFLACCVSLRSVGSGTGLRDEISTLRHAGTYLPVVEWLIEHERRVTMIPEGHWLLVRHGVEFRVTIEFGSGAEMTRLESCPSRDGWIAALPPGCRAGTARLTLRTWESQPRTWKAGLLFLSDSSLELATPPCLPEPDDLVLLTNQRGGMARLRVDLGRIGSKYDCLLGANLHPSVPVDRHVFVKRLRLWSNASHFLAPLNYDNLLAFTAGSAPVWCFRATAGADRFVTLEVRMRMTPLANTLRVVITRMEDPGGESVPVSVTARFDIEDRNFHSETKRNGGADHHFHQHTHPLEQGSGFLFSPAPDRRLVVRASSGSYHPAPEWCEHIAHPVEQSRGQEGSGDAFSPGWFELPLMAGDSVELLVDAELAPPRGPQPPLLEARGFFDRLVLAAESFVVRRGDGHSVIAGYPWFLDWGRDSLIAARGLIHCGKLAEVRSLLRTFARFERQGTLPNSIHGEDASNRDTSDAALWFGVVVEEVSEELKRAGGTDNIYQDIVDDAGRTVANVLSSIALGYLHGTPNGIHVDAKSALVWSPSHFTWMDTNHPAGTPREGYPVEIQALWIRLLRQLARISSGPGSTDWIAIATQAHSSIEKMFWIEKKGWYADVLRAPAHCGAAQAGVDDALRSNMLFLISLGIVNGERARATVLAAARHLAVPGALRSLAPLAVDLPLVIRSAAGHVLNHPHEPYWGAYQGDEDTRRKPAYHNGTAWCWTFPSFCEAITQAWPGDPVALAAARGYLSSVGHLLDTGCLGQLPEILDGDAPHRQRGCDAQAWSVTEAVRVWAVLGRGTSG